MKRKTNKLLGNFRAHIAVILGTLLSLTANSVRAAECVSITCPKDIVTGCQGEKGADECKAKGGTVVAKK